MNNEGNHVPAGSVDAVEQLLERATPRPSPPPDDARRIRESVHAEWRAVTVRRRSRRWGYAAVAATLAVCAVLAGRYLVTDDASPVEVAHIDKRAGSVYLVLEDAGLVGLGDVQSLLAGQVVQTAMASGLGFVYSDGLSVRLDEDSRLELVNPGLLYLQRGRVYIDAPRTGTAHQLTIRTDQGSITHVGTQYMVRTAGDRLTVSVREGKVRIDGSYYDAGAIAGESVTLLGANRPVTDGLATHGGPWRWTESLAPRLNIDGMPADEFLKWVSSETGYRIVYNDDSVRAVAGDTILKGIVDRDPRTELQLRLLTMDLAYDVDENRGLIRIRDAGTPH